MNSTLKIRKLNETNNLAMSEKNNTFLHVNQQSYGLSVLRLLRGTALRNTTYEFYFYEFSQFRYILIIDLIQSTNYQVPK